MDIFIVPLLVITKSVIGILSWVIIADVILSWLIAANIFNTNNHIIFSIIESINKLSDFLLDPIRRRIPLIGTLDISPLILILALNFLDLVLTRVLIKFSLLGG